MRGGYALFSMSALNLTKKDAILLPLGLALFVGSGVAVGIGLTPVATFLVAGAALGVLAAVVGEATDHLGNRFSPGVTGAVQSALGNLPELFFAIFALRAGLNEVVQATLVGSVLANVLLVLGAGFLVGGLKHGPQKFGREGSNRMGLLFLLSVAILAIPSLTNEMHLKVAQHEQALSIVGAIVLLFLFVLSIPATLRGETGEVARGEGEAGWPLWLVVSVLGTAAVGSAFVAEWFVGVLQPALNTLHISEAFAGLVIVAIVGNAVENVVGIQLMARNKAAYAVNVIVQSPIQIIYVLFPLLVLLSAAFGWGAFTMVLSPVLLSVLALSAVVTVVVVIDGESTWLEGACLMGFYVMIAASFWWG